MTASVYHSWSLLTPLPGREFWEDFFFASRKEFSLERGGLVLAERPLPLWLPCRVEAGESGGEEWSVADDTEWLTSELAKCKGGVAAGLGLKFLTGLADDFAEHLRRRGVGVAVTDYRECPEPLPEPGMDGRGGWGNEHRDVLEAIATHSSGRIEVAHINDALACAAALCRYFGGLNVVIPRPGRKQVGQTRAKLETLGAAGDHVRVGLYKDLPDVRPEELDVLLLLDAGELERTFASNAVHDAVANRRHQKFRGRVYGFVHAGHPRDRWSELSQAAYCGPVVYRRQPDEREVRVVWVENDSAEAVADNVTILERKRNTIWQNKARNELIAEIADAVAKQDRLRLEAFDIPHPYTAALDLPGTDPGTRVEPSVAVLAENEEHAKLLRGFLPGWVLVTRENVSGSPTPEYHQTGIVITQVAAAEYALPVDVLVRATGHFGTPRLRSFPCGSSGGDPPCLLIDVRDTFDQPARRASRRRDKEYARNGWTGG